MKLEDICFQPLSPANTHCVVNSAMQYFQVNIYSVSINLLNQVLSITGFGIFVSLALQKPGLKC